MKIYLASFLQPHNFGHGRIIGIVNGNKPEHVKVDFKYPPFTPRLEIIESYNSLRVSSPKEASDQFIFQYQNQLNSFVEDLLSKENSVQELLPFKDGDTFASWERAEFTNYRKILAPFLEKLGYEVVLN